jgi:hypothetical protein
MSVDVATEILIARPRARVAAFAADPDNATAWYENIESVQWKTDGGLVVGSRMDFVARFLGRRLSYTYEVKEYEPSVRFVMATSQGPFPMETIYLWEDDPAGETKMTLRNRGQPSGFSRILAPFMGAAMGRANTKDLQRLKALLEGEAR